MSRAPFLRHRGPVSCAIQVPGSTTILTSGYDNAVALFDTASLNVTLLGYHAHPVNRVSISKSGRYGVSASADHNLYLWDLADNKLLQVLKGHNGDVEDFVFINDELGASVSRDWRIILWDLKTGAIKRILSGHDKDVTSISYFDTRLYTTGEDKTLRIWDLQSGKLLTIIGPFNTGTCACATDAKNNRFILGTDDGMIQSFNIKTRQLITKRKGHHSAIKKIAVSPENGDILTVAYDQKILLWDAITLRQKQALTAHNSLWERSLHWSDDGTQIMGGTFDGTVLIWDAHSGECAQELGKDVEDCGNACFNDVTSQGNEQITLVSDDGYVRVGILSEKSAQWQQSVEPDSGRVLMNAVTFCPIRKHVITGARNQHLYLFDNHRQMLKQKLSIELNEGPINCIKTSTLEGYQGEMFVACESGILAHLSADGQLLNKIPAHENPIRALALHPMRAVGVSCCNGGALTSWNYNAKVLKEYVGHSAIIDAVDIDPSGRFIASAGRDFTLKIHGIDDGTLYHNIPLGRRSPTSLCFVSPHVVLVTNYWGEVLRVSLQSGSITRQTVSHNGISSITRHGDHYALSSYDGSVYLIEQNQLTVLNSLRSMTQQIQAPAFN